MPEPVTFEHYEVLTRDDGSLHELGRGAMGITYKGFDTRLRVPVALKVINAAHLHSETVEAFVKRQGPLLTELALRITAQVARALNAAQAQDLVHRDIKPSNLMIVHEDEELVVKVIDFGLAKVSFTGDAGASSGSLTL